MFVIWIKIRVLIWFLPVEAADSFILSWNSCDCDAKYFYVSMKYFLLAGNSVSHSPLQALKNLPNIM